MRNCIVINILLFKSAPIIFFDIILKSIESILDRRFNGICSIKLI